MNFDYGLYQEKLKPNIFQISICDFLTETPNASLLRYKKVFKSTYSNWIYLGQSDSVNKCLPILLMKI